MSYHGISTTSGRMTTLVSMHIIVLLSEQPGWCQVFAKQWEISVMREYGSEYPGRGTSSHKHEVHGFKYDFDSSAHGDSQVSRQEYGLPS